MREHATREEPRNGQLPVPALPGKPLVLMIGVVVAGHAAKQRHVPVCERASEREGLPEVHLVERFPQPLLELRRRLRRQTLPSRSAQGPDFHRPSSRRCQARASSRRSLPHNSCPPARKLGV